MAGEMKDLVLEHLQGHAEVVESLKDLADETVAMAESMAGVLREGGSIWMAGNGGSAADAQHLAAEMEGRLKLERPARAVHSLGTNVSTISSLGNDYGFDQIYSRQVAGFLRRSDLLFLISTSGNSPNLLEAARAASGRGIPVFSLLGKGGGQLLALSDRALLVPADDTQWAQEAQIALGHILCDLVDRILGAD